MAKESYGWTSTQFGTAEQFKGAVNWESHFYSHSYSEKGRADVLQAATDYIERAAENDTIKRIALKLMEQEGVETELYQRETNERWFLNAGDILKRATEIARVI